MAAMTIVIERRYPAQAISHLGGYFCSVILIVLGGKGKSATGATCVIDADFFPPIQNQGLGHILVWENICSLCIPL